MQVKSKYKLVVLGAIASTACALGYKYLPEKRLVDYPAEGMEPYSLTDSSLGGSTQINIFSHLPLHWQCDVRQGDNPF